jgi:hypothetical protein
MNQQLAPMGSHNAFQSSNQNLGSTWVDSGKLNIDIDNLSLGGVRKQGGGKTPSMNQLAVSSPSPTSPLGFGHSVNPSLVMGMPQQSNQAMFNAFN